MIEPAATMPSKTARSTAPNTPERMATSMPRINRPPATSNFSIMPQRSEGASAPLRRQASGPGPQRPNNIGDELIAAPSPTTGITASHPANVRPSARNRLRPMASAGGRLAVEHQTAPKQAPRSASRSGRVGQDNALNAMAKAVSNENSWGMMKARASVTAMPSSSVPNTAPQSASRPKP